MTRIVAAALAFFCLQSAQAADLPMDYGQTRSEATAGPQAGAGMKTLAACQRAIAAWAEPFGPVDIQTVIVGPVQRQFNGTKIAPLFVRIVYDTQGGRETRKANVRCTVDASDAVAVEPTE